MNSMLLRTAVSAVLLVAAGASGSCSAPNSPTTNTTTPTEAEPAPRFEDLSPSDFVDTIDNPYFPKLPGTRWVYEGITADGLERTESEVLSETLEIEGIQATVVTNQDYLDGELTEDNLDYFAQDRDGNVWYLGENVDNYDARALHDHAGSWLAGDDGAIPGIVMLADPHIGQVYEQEHLLGCTRDKAEVLSVDERVSVPTGEYAEVLLTHDTSDTETDLDEHKFYAQGVGLVKTIDRVAGNEFVLVEFSG
jgi:hypothetical protein